MVSEPRQPTEEERPSVLVHYPSLAEALDDLIDEYGLDLVQEGLEEWLAENKGE